MPTCIAQSLSCMLFLTYLFHILVISPAIACIPSYMTRILLLPHKQAPLYGREKSTKERMATRPLRLA